jgi:hypothetical protein
MMVAVGFRGEVKDWHCCWLKLGMGLIDELSLGKGVAEVEVAAFAACFDTIWREYVG